MRSDLVRLVLAMALPLPLAACGDSSTIVGTYGPGGSFSSQPAPASLQIVSGGEQSAYAGQTLPTPITVKALDKSGGGLRNVTLNASLSIGSVVPATATTGQAGTASFEVTLGSQPGDLVFTVQHDTVQTTTVLTALDPDSLSRLTVLSGDGQEGEGGLALPEPIMVQALRVSGSPMTNVVIHASASAGDVAPDSALSGEDGAAAFTLTLPTTAGTITVTFTAAMVSTTADASVASTTFSSVSSMTEGAEATIAGAELDHLTSLIFDGTPVPFTIENAKTVRFTVPMPTNCTLDGRKATLEGTGNGRTQLVAPVHGAYRMNLSVGESRVVSGDELSCLQIPTGDDDYVLSVANLSRTASYDHLFDFTSYVDGGNSPAPLPRRVSTPSQIDAKRALDAHVRAIAEATAALPSPRPGYTYLGGGPQDPVLTDGLVGDTVHFIDWSQATCTDAHPPTYPAVIAGLSGKSVVLVDLRLPDADRAFDPAVQPELQNAAALVDETLLPTERGLFRPTTDVLQNAGGRTFSLITLSSRMPSYATAVPSYGDIRPRSVCAASDEIQLVLLGEMALAERSGTIAATTVHEHTHLMDIIETYLDADVSASSAWFVEALAATSEELAARIGRGEMTQASFEAIQSDEIRPHWGVFPMITSGEFSPFATWGQPGDTPRGASGEYILGSEMLLFARELHGDANPGPSGTEGPARLARELSTGGWTLEHMAQLAGLDVDTFLDEFALASVTDDLVAGGDHGLPHFESWNHTQTSRDFYFGFYGAGGQVVPRTQPVTASAQVGGGSYAFWAIPGDSERTVSIGIADDASAPSHVIRLSRIR